MIFPRKRLLIAEDDCSFRETLIVEFAERDYEVTAIASVAEFGQLDDQTFDRAVIDLKLDMDSGLELLELLLQASPDVRSVILTGYGSIATAVKAMQLGATNYLTKPVGIDELEAAFMGREEESETEAYNAPSLARHEWEYIEYVLDRCGGNISKAAKELGIHRQSLQRKLRKYPPRA
jgi:two-component system response regulator RegA